MDQNIHFLSFQVLKLSETVLDTIKMEHSGPFYSHLVRIWSNSLIFLQLRPLTQGDWRASGGHKGRGGEARGARRSDSMAGTDVPVYAREPCGVLGVPKGNWPYEDYMGGWFCLEVDIPWLTCFVTGVWAPLLQYFQF